MAAGCQLFYLISTDIFCSVFSPTNCYEETTTGLLLLQRELSCPARTCYYYEENLDVQQGITGDILSPTNCYKETTIGLLIIQRELRCLAKYNG